MRSWEGSHLQAQEPLRRPEAGEVLGQGLPAAPVSRPCYAGSGVSSVKSLFTVFLLGLFLTIYRRFFYMFCFPPLAGYPRGRHAPQMCGLSFNFL